MRQPTLCAFVGHSEDNALASDGSMEAWDLFCGAGGFSEGARAAGCRVAFACDSSPEAITTHTRNHPDTVHWTCELPCELPLPTDGRRFHLHASPPCQKFSQVNQKGRSSGDRTTARTLVEWFLELALASRATSWSMEQVPSKYVVEAVDSARRQHPHRVAYNIFLVSKLGVPQNRRRLIAGTPSLIRKLERELKRQVSCSIRSAVQTPRGTHVRGGTTTKRNTLQRVPDGHGGERSIYERSEWTDSCYPIDGPAPTVIGRHALTWVSGSGEKCNRSVLYPSELAALQTFPATYRWPENKFQAYLQIGNAVPPRVAQLLLEGESASAPAKRKRPRCVSPSLAWNGPLGKPRPPDQTRP